MTFAAVTLGAEVKGRLADLVDAVMARTTRLGLIRMTEVRGGPAERFVADGAFLLRRNVGCRLGLRICHYSTVVAIVTGGWRSFENTLDVATFACGVGMHPGQWKPGLLVVEVDAGTRPLGRHR